MVKNRFDFCHWFEIKLNYSNMDFTFIFTMKTLIHFVQMHFQDAHFDSKWMLNINLIFQTIKVRHDVRIQKIIYKKKIPHQIMVLSIKKWVATLTFQAFERKFHEFASQWRLKEVILSKTSGVFLAFFMLRWMNLNERSHFKCTSGVIAHFFSFTLNSFPDS